MKILIANPGSTSYKCKLFDMETMHILFQAAIEKIGDKESICSHQFEHEEKRITTQEIPDYFRAVNLTLEILSKKIALDDVAAIGFKTVLAKGVSGCVRLTEDVIEAMKAYEQLAPVHTRVYLNAISVFQKILKETPLVGLFETSFHQTIPSEAYLYGIPFRYYENHGVRKYGFHGASHRYIATRIKEVYLDNGQESFKVIWCHLGGSSSVCAIKDGISVDTSMGMSPQCGLLNAKRVGDLDPFALLYIMEQEKLSIEQMREILVTEGGVLGISGFSGDLRDIEKGLESGNRRAELAFKTFGYVVKRYIGEYLVVLNGTDFIVFTGGIGQNSPHMRKLILMNMENLGILMDDNKNNQNPMEDLISSDRSSVRIVVIPTNEEWVVAREVKELIDLHPLKI